MEETEKADRFLDIFRDMVLAYNREMDLPQMLSYYAVLRTLDLECIVAAARRLRKTSTFFPSAAEWHRLATAFAIDRAQEFTLAQEGESKGPHCAVCGDSGFAPGSQPRFVRKCDCRKTNPTLERERLTLTRLRGTF